MLWLRVLPLVPFLVALSAVESHGWGGEELEIFDLVEELAPRTFYETLNVSNDASSAEIRRAYRRSSLQFHPDKNKESNAEEVFRQLTAVADVLRDEEKRAIYDRVLVEGLPNWQQPVYYYRQVRRMGTLELLIAVSLIMTVVHYGYLCAVFVDHYYQAELATTRRKRKSKKWKSGGAVADDTEADNGVRSPFPGPLNLLPFVLVRNLVAFLCAAPFMWREWQESKQRQREEIQREKEEAAEQERQTKEDAIRAADFRQRRIQYRLQQKQDALQDAAEADDLDWGRIPNIAETAVADCDTASEDAQTATTLSSLPWTEEELNTLTRAFVRFPGGTLSRWEKIADEVGRSVSDVTAQVKRLKHRVAKAEPLGSSLESSRRAAQATSRLTDDITVRTDGSDRSTAVVGTTSSAATSAAGWLQEEQKLLEKALAKYGRDVEARWTRIAEAIPGRSKEECVARFKYIAMQVRQRKPVQQPSGS